MTLKDIQAEIDCRQGTSFVGSPEDRRIRQLAKMVLAYEEFRKDVMANYGGERVPPKPMDSKWLARQHYMLQFRLHEIEKEG
jgi:hypothetical protein